jgi:hypothetical protein
MLREPLKTKLKVFRKKEMATKHINGESEIATYLMFSFLPFIDYFQSTNVFIIPQQKQRFSIVILIFTALLPTMYRQDV